MLPQVTTLGLQGVHLKNTVASFAS